MENYSTGLIKIFPPRRIANDIELLKTLIEESNLQPQDLAFILNGEETITQTLNEEIQLTDHQIEQLAAFFKISPAAFR